MTDATVVSRTVAGFRTAGVYCGLKADGVLDFALIASDSPCIAAGVFTTNHVKAAPVLFNMEVLAQSSEGIRAVAVNTRCANACTGEQGLANAKEMARLTAEKLGVPVESVLVMSTGVIGTQLPMEKIARGVALSSADLRADDAAWHAASQGIMTTDTRPKIASAAVSLSGGQVHITGIAKGAGMIAPNMATMLSVIVTDAALSIEQCQRLLRQSSDVSFNRIVVDGDTSTNDTVLLLANGASGASLASAADESAFMAALVAVSTQLAQAVVRDGEGATKFITIDVTGAPDDAAAKQIANTIATSPLVKTAFYGGDANWGRIVAAAGRAGIPMDPEVTTLVIARAGEQDGLLLFADGMPTAYDETLATEIVKAESVDVRLSVGQGSGAAIVWTCDLSHDYVSINGHYRS
ncbi:MAG: bifunctional glutamate N-acetyltransferase/amino-acid acetyltransferase ArgJ [Chloroflexi bacterium]|nr:bifunctional glutamate N-acetyltransferase/amino-acid acetyltransferase ArgJ [Chloroflexota bacterium]